VKIARSLVAQIDPQCRFSPDLPLWANLPILALRAL